MTWKFETDEELAPNEGVVVARVRLDKRHPGLVKGRRAPCQVVTATGETVEEVIDLEAARARKAS